ncbi:formylmethanofuran dehydrogenase subunit C [Paraburkholderia phymatum]|uniref:Formylmethanofuran dehydrogenase subunit C n=1 Tax=Paraburkholderia phymatum (strain DSM 17167 / CIP 108236 / LMG 21445 / STM815) TaxID=391038 RepID=B2JX60_PARP8|nr:formylmethanofuran dehydrogenase subunit C [Paraburkholderia phymatum]ACC75537.1 formylmethanofuran dehydrogenase subunit C [Paraburkholderia phymatum STM815]
MSAITLRVKHAPGFRVDGTALSPSWLGALSEKEIARVMLPAGNDAYALGDLFDIAVAADDNARVVIEGDAQWLDRLGTQLDAGSLRIEGCAGDYAGWRMAGGTLEITGDAGAFTGCGMRGGTLAVTGNSGDFVAGALPGDMEGMTGGTLIVAGNAGERLGDRMRRGTVLIGGNAGNYAASRLVAGTIGIAGRLGAHYGYGMRRGTLLLLQQPERIPPTFTTGGRGFEVFWSLFARALAAQCGAAAAVSAAIAQRLAPFAALDVHKVPQRYAGDLAVDGRGELLLVE